MRYGTIADQSPAIPRSREWIQSLVTYAVLVCIALVLFADVVHSTVVTWWFTTAFNHCMFVGPASIFLAWRRRRSLMSETPCFDYAGVLLLLMFSGGWLIAKAAEVMLFQQFALVGIFISLFVAIFGRKIAWKLAFPLAFLFLMVPFGQGLIPVLQDFTAAFAVRVLRLLEIPVFLDGVLIAIPGGLFEVAEACAGLRFLIANVVIALLFCYVSFRRPWKWIVFIIISIVIPIIANAFRATAIILIAYWTNNEYAAGVDHIVYGWVFFAVIMISLLAIGNAFADPVIEDTDEPSLSRQKPAGTLPLTYSAPLVLAVLLVTPSYAAIMLKTPTAVPHLALPAVDVGAPWEPVAASNWQPSISDTDLTIARAYEQDGRRVDLFIGYYAYQRPGAELVSEKEGLADGQLWRTAERQQEELGIPGLPAMVELERLKTVANDERVSLGLYWTAGRFVTNRYEVLAWLALDRLLGRNRPAAFIALSAPFTTTMAEGVTNLKKFLADNRDLPDYLNSIEITRPLGKS